MIDPAPGAHARITVGAGAKYSTSRHRINNAICSSFCIRVLDTTDVVRGGNLEAGHVPCVGRTLLVADAAEGGLEETCLPPPVAPAPTVQVSPTLATCCLSSMSEHAPGSDAASSSIPAAAPECRTQGSPESTASVHEYRQRARRE